MKYQSGQLLRSEVDSFPMLKHFGVIYVEDNGQVKVMHNTPTKGGTEISTIEEFTSDRTIVDVTNSPLMLLSNDELKQRYLDCSGSFDLVRYNCEHFIDCMHGRKYGSEQVKTVVLFGGILIGLYLAI
jgi:hypothetical protein